MSLFFASFVQKKVEITKTNCVQKLKKTASLLAIVPILIMLMPAIAFANVTVAPALGGSLINSSTAGGAYTALASPMLQEENNQDIGTGTIILNAPTGFIFDASSTVTATVLNRPNGDGTNLTLLSGTAVVTTNTITTTVTAMDQSGATRSILYWLGIKVRPTAVSPLASGNITKSGTAAISGVVNGTTNLGTLTEVDDSRPTAAITYSVIPSSVKPGDTLILTATFSEPMANSPVPKIAISGANTVAASDMTKLTSTSYYFSYTVGAGDGIANVSLSEGKDLAGLTVISTPSSGATFTVDSVVPTCPAPTITKGTNPGAQHIVGSTIYYTTKLGAGSFTVSENASDTTDIPKVNFPNTVSWGGDVTSPPYQKTYSWISSPESTYDGTATITCQDNVGNTATSTFTVNKDNDAPVVNSVTPDKYFVKDGDTINITSNVTETGSGIASCNAYWSTDTALGGDTDLGDLGTDCNGSVTVPAGSGTHYILIGSTLGLGDNVGLFQPSGLASAAILVDNTAPSTSDNTGFGGQTYLGTKTFTLTANDHGGSGVANTKYCVADFPATCTPNISGTSVTVTAPGVASSTKWIFYQSTDNAGNIEAFGPHSYSFTIVNDLIPPTTTDSGIDGNWHNSNVAVTLTCNDTGGSNCATTYYTTDGTEPSLTSLSGNFFSLSADGTHTVKYFSVDNAGNTESVKTAANQVKIDKTAPTTSGALESGTFSANGWFISDVTYRLYPFDALSGLHSTNYCLDIIGNCSPSLSYSSSITISTNSADNHVRFRSDDFAGNIESIRDSNVIKIDKTIPTSSVNPLAVYYNTGIVTLPYTSADNVSGIANVKLYYSKDSGPWTQFTSGSFTSSPISFNANTAEGPNYNGTYEFRTIATDNAGNIEGAKTVSEATTIVDTTAPTVTKVDTTHANGAFKVGEVIDFTVTYSEPVTVIGGPVLGLNSAGVANYLSGSGTDTLTFRYMVDPGENSNDLDYESTYSLSLVGGSIKDAALNNANNALPAVGTFAAAHAIVIDTVAPSYSWNFPAVDSIYKDGQPIYVEASITETGSGITDGVSCNPVIHSVVGYFTGTVIYTIATGKCAGTIILSNPSYLNDGTHHITLNVADNAGNSMISADRNILIDNTAPTITITNPNTDPALSKTVTASVNDGTLSMFINETGVTTCDASLSFISYADTTFDSESDNGKTICYKAIDAVGNTTYQLSNPVAGIDRTAPPVPSMLDLQDASDSGISNSDNITNKEFGPTFNVLGVADSDYYHIYMCGAGNCSWSQYPFLYSGTQKQWGLSQWGGDYTYRFAVTAVDALGNESAMSPYLDVVLDVTSPSTAEITAPQNDETISGTYNIVANAIDDYSGIDRVEFYHESLPTLICTDNDPSNGFSCDWNTTLVADGPHQLYIIAYDKAGNQVQSSDVDVTVDNTAPVITGDFYRQGAFDHLAKVGDIVQVNFVTSEPISIDSMSIAGHAIPSYQPQNNTHFYIVYTMQSSDTEGPLTYSLTGHDVADNSTTVTGGGVTFDKTAPTATVAYSTTAPTTGNVTATITPSETVTINGGSTTYTFTDNGTFTFDFQDAAGNIGSRVATVSNIDRTAPVITLNGGNMSLKVGQAFNDPGASTNDGSAVITSGTVNTALAGSYTIRYNSTDAAGNVAKEVVRIVTVNPASGGIVSGDAYTEIFQNGNFGFTDTNTPSGGTQVEGTQTHQDNTNTPTTNTGAKGSKGFNWNWVWYTLGGALILLGAGYWYAFIYKKNKTN